MILSFFAGLVWGSLTTYFVTNDAYFQCKVQKIESACIIWEKQKQGETK